MALDAFTNKNTIDRLLEAKPENKVPNRSSYYFSSSRSMAKRLNDEIKSPSHPILHSQIPEP